MEPILENIELPSPNPQAPPNWNPVNAPIPLEFYDNAPDPRYSSGLNSSFADFNFDGDSRATSTLELDFSDPEFQSFEDESDASSVKSSDSKKIAQGRNRVDKRREWGLSSPVSPIPRNSKRTETYQYHLISPIIKDRYHYVSKDNPKFKELEGKDPEFDECRYKYFVICVGSHFWKRTRNQVVRPGRSGARRQKQVQVRDRRMNVQTFYYSLTFELETMAPLRLRSYSDVIKAIKTQIPPQAPQLFSVTYTTFDSPVKLTVTSQALASPVGSNHHPPELTYSKDFKSCKEVDPFAPGNFMDNLDELSHLDVATTKGGPVLVTSVQCAKVDSFGNISPVEFGESKILECNTDVSNASFDGTAQELILTSSPTNSRNEKSLQLTPNSSIFKASSSASPARVAVDLSPNSASSLHKTVHTTIVGGASSSQGSSAAPPPPPERTVASMNRSPERYVSPVFFHQTESHSSVLNNSSSMDPQAISTSWTNVEDSGLLSEWNKFNTVDIIENPSLGDDSKQVNRKKHKCAFTGPDGLCRCCHFSDAHAHEGHYQDMTDSGISGDLYGSSTSLDTLINELWTLSKPETEEKTDSQSAAPDWSCKISPAQDTKETPVKTRQRKRPSSPRLPENFVADMDQILQQQIADLERAQSFSPEPKSLSESPVRESIKPERPTTLNLQKTEKEDRSQNYEVDALGGDEDREFTTYLRHSPIDSDLDTSSVSSYNSLSPQPRSGRKHVMFKDENEAFDYFRVKHFDSPYVQPDVIKKQTATESRDPPPAPPRGSSRSKTSARLFYGESDAFDYFKVKHFPKFEEQDASNREYIRTRQELIDQLSNYTPRIQPAVPKRKDSSKKFQRRLMELSRLSEACGEAADQIKQDHQEYWGALTDQYKVPGGDESSLVTEAYQRMSAPDSTGGQGSFSSPPESRKPVQTDLKRTGMISAAVSDNIVNMASSVNNTSGPRTMRNEIRIDLSPSPEVKTERPSLIPAKNQGQNHRGRNLGQGFWSSSSRGVDAPRPTRQNHQRSVTWCDDLTSTDDDRMSDSSASVTPDRKLDPALSLKSIQKTHTTKKKKKKVSWSDDYNTDDDRHSSSTSLSSVFEPNSPDVPRHVSSIPGFGPGITSPPVNTHGEPFLRSPQAFQRNNTTWPLNQNQQTACPIFGQPLLSQAAANSRNGVSSHQQILGSSQNPQLGAPGSAKTCIGVQRFKVDNKFPVEKPHVNLKPQGLPKFPVEKPQSPQVSSKEASPASKSNGHDLMQHQQFRC